MDNSIQDYIQNIIQKSPIEVGGGLILELDTKYNKIMMDGRITKYFEIYISRSNIISIDGLLIAIKKRVDTYTLSQKNV